MSCIPPLFEYPDRVCSRAGIDDGGVFKEFFTSLCKEVFDIQTMDCGLRTRKTRYIPTHIHMLQSVSLWVSLHSFFAHVLVPSLPFSGTQPEVISVHWSHSGEGPLRGYSGRSNICWVFPCKDEILDRYRAFHEHNQLNMIAVARKAEFSFSR